MLDKKEGEKMETRILKVQIGKAGTGKGARINLSLPFLRDVLGVTDLNREIKITYDEENKKITLEKVED